MFADSADIQLFIKKVMEKQYFAVLASVGQGQPYSNLVAYTFTEDLKTIWFITSRNTRKYDNIKANKQVSLLIDNRRNQPEDLSGAVAITAIGTVHEETTSTNQAKSIFLARHPYLKEFINQPGTAIIAVGISEYIVASFSQTQRLKIN
ncbi:MAG: pyridoxamine 5'-phosphate oxidase family protein [Dehalococcoidales bacterium]|nr:pyridoxamine 5'-phosphate oxidase family protein [Dehalococcoidales bacterium]